MNRITAVWVIGFSLGLAGHYCFRAPSVPGNAISPIASVATNFVTKSSIEDFDWAEIETTDWAQLRANLLSIRCPTDTVADILRSRIKFDYQRRINTVFDPLAVYWTAPSEHEKSKARRRQLLEERDALLASLNISLEAVDTNMFSPSVNQHIAKAKELYPIIQLNPASTSEERNAAREGRQNRINYLGQFLTPEELLAYRMDQDGDSWEVSHILEGLLPSDEEYKRVFSALDGQDFKYVNGTPFCVTPERLREALGDKRYNYLQELRSPQNAYFLEFVDRARMPEEQAQQLMKLRREFDPENIAQFHDAVAAIINDRAKLAIFFRWETPWNQPLRTYLDSLPKENP